MSKKIQFFSFSSDIFLLKIWKYPFPILSCSFKWHTLHEMHFPVMQRSCDILLLQHLQKQPSRGVLRKRCSENMQQIYMRTPMPKCDFNKFALLYNFIEIALQHGCSHVNLLHIFRTPFLHNNRRLLLKLVVTKSLTKSIFSKNRF